MSKYDFMLVEIEQTCDTCDTEMISYTYKFLWENHRDKEASCSCCGERNCTVNAKLLEEKLWNECLLEC